MTTTLAIHHAETEASRRKAICDSSLASIWLEVIISYSLVPRLSAQLFFAHSKISGYFTTCEKKLGREPGNEAKLAIGLEFGLYGVMIRKISSYYSS